MMSASQPAADELEVSIFGPGFGECIVVHLGDGEWMVVDSCIDPSTRNPVALDYLASLKVDVAKQVKLVVATHWHDDHMAGVARVLDACLAAEFACSGALRNEEYKTLLATSGTAFLAESGVDEFHAVAKLVLERKRGQRAASAGPIWALANKPLYRGLRSEVTALSPSDACLTLAFHEFANLLPGLGDSKRRLVAQRPNAVCAVLWIQFGDARVLLGADLETTRNPSTGWTAIINSTTRPGGRAQIYKVAHHGSANADDPLIWANLLTPQAHAGLTPFRGGARTLPGDRDRARILGKTDNAFCTAKATAPKVKLSDAGARKLAKIVAPDLQVIESPMGHVRFRHSPTTTIDVQLSGEARHLSAAG